MLKRIITPKFAFFMMLAPFVFLCPLTITSILSGFPIDTLINNRNIRNFEESFESIQTPQGSTQIGQTVTKIGLLNEQPGRCDYVSARVVITELRQEILSELVLENYQSAFSLPASQIPHFSLINGASIKLFPVDLTTDLFDNEEVQFSLQQDFNISNISLEDEEQAFIIYLINFNVNSSRDRRCY